MNEPTREELNGAVAPTCQGACHACKEGQHLLCSGRACRCQIKQQYEAARSATRRSRPYASRPRS